MSKRIELIDNIQATKASDNIEFASIIEYVTPKTDYADNEVPNAGWVKGIAGDETIIVISEGTQIPFSIYPVIDFSSASSIPEVLQTIPKGSGWTTNGANTISDYIDNSFGSLARIDIWGVDDGSTIDGTPGKFATDTKIRVF